MFLECVCVRVCVCVCVLVLQLKFCFGSMTRFCLQGWEEASWLVATQLITAHAYSNAREHTTPTKSQPSGSFCQTFFVFCTKSSPTYLVRSSNPRNNVRMHSSVHTGSNYSFCVRVCLFVCFSFVSVNLGAALIVIILTDDEMESQPTLGERFVRLSRRIFESRRRRRSKR